MNLYMQKQKTQSHAMMEAARALERLGIDQSQPVDIFKVIQNEEVWLNFQPLKSLYGFYLKRGETAGIGINSKHPLSVQRFTAAHEYAHYILKHDESMDDVTYIERAYSSTNLNEIAADTFAAHFLMPIQLVNTLLKRMGLPRNPQSLTPVQIYQLALDMGVSYTATVNHLAAIKIISIDDAQALRRIPPKQIKAQLKSQPLENSWADIWVLDKTDTGKELHLRVYDDLKICLPENPTTGYLWTFDSQLVNEEANPTVNRAKPGSGMIDAQRPLFKDASLEDTSETERVQPLALISDEFEAASSSAGQRIYGGEGNRYFTVRTLFPGKYSLRLLERRPWEDISEAIEEFVVNLEVAPKLTGEGDHGLVAFQQKAVGSTFYQGSEAA
jgi:Zn-dependent peptidase ImmA (M78 family)